ncbi:hypothetical protein HDU98_007157 [Podochytrium sp. JEL0797]|nr:hypothetical protein HDU98_007157 [Podochytrium sp. JEL0797]
MSISRKRKILVVLDLNGTLIDRLGKGPERKAANMNPLCPKEPDLTLNNNKVYLRPYLNVFLQFLFDNFHVSAWTSATPKNSVPLVDFIFEPFGGDKLLEFVWDREKCIIEPTPEKEYNSVKDLSKIWTESVNDQGTWNQHNTILMDDSACKSCRTPLNHLLVPTFSVGDLKLTRNCDEDSCLLSSISYLKDLIASHAKAESTNTKWSVQQFMQSSPLYIESFDDNALYLRNEHAAMPTMEQWTHRHRAGENRELIGEAAFVAPPVKKWKDPKEWKPKKKEVAKEEDLMDVVMELETANGQKQTETSPKKKKKKKGKKVKEVVALEGAEIIDVEVAAEIVDVAEVEASGEVPVENGWVHDVQSSIDMAGCAHVFGITASGSVQEVKQAIPNGGFGSTWTTVGSGSAQVNKSSSALNGAGLLEVWGVGPSGVRKCVQTDSATWGAWISVDTRADIVDVKVVTDVNGTVIPFFLSNARSLLFGVTYTPLMTNVSNIQPIFDVTNTTLSQQMNSYSVVSRNDGFWELYGLKSPRNTPGAVHYTTQQQLNIAQNCFNSTFANQKDCTTVSPSSSAAALAFSLSSAVAAPSTIAASTAASYAVATSAAVTSAVAASDTAPSALVASAAASSSAIIISSAASASISSAAPSSTTSPTASVSPNADCVTITQAFPRVQFNIDCYNVSPNATYPVGAPAQRRRSSTDYLAFQNGHLVQVILANLGLQGTIPPMLGNLGQMMVLDLSGNSLVGAIPPQLASCTNLQQIDLQNNQLTGTIPAALTQLFATNGVTVSLGTNCLANSNNQRASCHKQGIDCLSISLDNGYSGPEYEPLWTALAASGGDLNAFDEVAAAQAYFGYAEYMYQAFRAYARERISCMLAFPGVPFGTNARRNLHR